MALGAKAFGTTHFLEPLLAKLPTGWAKGPLVAAG